MPRQRASEIRTGMPIAQRDQVVGQAVFIIEYVPKRCSERPDVPVISPVGRSVDRLPGTRADRRNAALSRTLDSTIRCRVAK